ncbi:quinone-dependent dihydroorotate dehydrogenase [Vulgatibacter incomptus]|nr:quinone-dependent dihydroorotate dehydrogenase [Vulgatibacter incomptus]
MYPLLRPLFFLVDPERIHHLVARFLRLIGRNVALASRIRRSRTLGDPRLAVRAFGLDFPGPVGLAAGFDKGDGLAAGAFALGFGSVEVGTITPRAQPGNPRPRLFRLPRQQALINRMGFNNAGAEATASRYAELAFRPGPVGMNLGKNKDTPSERAPEDYLTAFETLAGVGDYFVVNVSSPNTPGLRDLQAPAALRAILGPLVAAAKGRGGKPVLLKLAPDLTDEAVDELADLAVEEGLAGLILANTTIGRPTAESEAIAREAGGMSGAPLLPRSLEIVRRVRRRLGDRLPIIGVGGIFGAEDAYRMIRAGATLVQVYTGFVYQGPGMVRTMEQGLIRLLDRDGLAKIADAVGLDAKD